MNAALTSRQKRIFEYIRRQIDSRGYGPTVREIADQFNIGSPNGVVGHLKALEQKGYIQRAARKSRAIELSSQFVEATRGMPLAGRVAAGALAEAIESRERIDFGSLIGRRGAYVLKVAGDSMIEAHICDGDYVIVQPRRTAHAGDIVVVCTEDGESTLKYWYPEKNRVRLQPANRRMKPIYTRDAKVTGVVVGVIRDMS